MRRYRIDTDYGFCDGCIAMTVYWVQVYAKLPIIGHRWVNVKGFDTKGRAEELLNYLIHGTK